MDIIFDQETIHGSGAIAEETYALSDVTGVQLSTLGELEIRLGDREELRIEADDNLLPYFEAEQVGEVVRIRSRRGTRLRPSAGISEMPAASGVRAIVSRVGYSGPGWGSAVSARSP